MLILTVHHQKAARITASVISAVAFAVLMVMTFTGYHSNAYSFGIGLDEEKYPVSEGWTAELEDPDNGTVELDYGGDGFSPTVHLDFKDFTKNTNVILRDPDGNAWPFPIRITKNGNSVTIDY